MGVTGRQYIHIILNPIAGARHRGLLDAVVRLLRMQGARIEIEETQAPAHGTSLARRAALEQEPDVIVAAGGDGTINEVARGLLGTQVPLGIIPLGTANVLAVELGLRPKAPAIADMIAHGPADLIGTGLVGGELFLLMVGIGFDGEVVHHINPRLKRWTGRGAFAWAGFKLWLKGPGRDIQMRVDGREERAAWVVVVNARHFAGPYVLAPQAELARPGLYAVLFRRPGRWAFVRYLLALGLGRVDRLKDVDVMAVRQIDFLEPQGLAVEVDGDARGALPQRVEQGVRYLRLVVPRARAFSER